MEFLRSFLNASMDAKMFVLAFVLISTLLQSIFLKKKRAFAYIFIYNIILFGVLALVFNYDYRVHLLILVPSIFLSFILYGILPDKSGKKKVNDPWRVVMKVVKGGKAIVIANLKRGAAIFGSAGAGKTASIFVPLIKHCAEHNFSGMGYDYKNGELTEIFNYFYANSKVPIYTIIPHAPQLTCRVNPIHPKFIDGEDEVSQLVSVLFANTRPPGAKFDPFWDGVPEAALCAVIWRLRVDFTDYCTLPHAIGICVNSNAEELAEFIAGNTRSKLIGRPYLDAMTSENTISGIKSSMSNGLRKFCLPNIFYTLTGDDVHLACNTIEHKGFINLVNDPTKEDVYSPFLAMLFCAIMNKMRDRNRERSVLLLDEAATLTIPKFSRIPATLRSFDIATVYSLQDKVLGEEQMGAVAVKSILANLSYIFAGKSNDPDSIKYYKQIMEEVEEKKISKSKASGLFAKGESRINESQQRTNKYKNQDYAGLRPGEFLVMADGKDRKVRFVEVPFERVEMKVRNYVTKADLDQHFDKILEEAQMLIDSVVEQAE